MMASARCIGLILTQSDKNAREIICISTKESCAEKSFEDDESSGDSSIFFYEDNRRRLLDLYVSEVSVWTACAVFTNFISKFIDHIHYVEKLLDIFREASNLEKVFMVDVLNKFCICKDSEPVDHNYYKLCWEAVDVTTDIASCYAKRGYVNFDENFSSCIHLSNEIVGCVKGLNKCAAMVYLMQKRTYEKIALIDYNHNCLLEGFTDLTNFESKDCKKFLDSFDFAWSMESLLDEECT